MSAVLFNLHSEYNRAKLIPDIAPRPAAILFHPISPALNATELTGFMAVVHNWDTVLVQAVPKQTKSIQVVVSDGVRLATFLVSSDSAKFIGWGDMHDRTYDKYKRFFSPSDGPAGIGYEAYSFTIYPTADHFPPDVVVASTVGCVVVVAFVLIIAAGFFIHHNHLQGRLWQQEEMHGGIVEATSTVTEQSEIQLNLTEEPRTAGLGLAGFAESEDFDCDDAAVQQSKALELCKDLIQKVQAWFQLLKEVEESSTDAVTTLNELLSYDKIEQKTMTIEKEPLAAWDIVSSAVKPFNIQARERNLVIHTELEPHTHPSTRDAEEIPLVDSESHQKELNELLVIGDSVEIKAVWCPKNLMKQGATMIASMDDLSKRSLYDARGSLKVSVKDYGPGECMLTTVLLQLRYLIMTTTAGLTVDNLKRLF
eukprot:gene26363-34492_t